MTRLRDRLPRRLRTALGTAGRRGLSALAGPFQPSVPAGRILALCHCHHADLVPELAGCLLALPRGAAVHVSSSDPDVFAAWEPFRGRSRAAIAFHAVENRGRDLLPFFTLAGRLAIAPDAAVLKIHGKRSAYSDQGEWWRRDTLRGLLPGPFAAARALSRFDADPRLALLGAPGSFIANPAYWGGNRPEVGRLMGGVAGLAIADTDLAFIAGTMFWMRGGFLSALLPHVDASLFEPEPIARDGTHAHALERVIGMAALAWGWHIGETDAAAPLTREAARHRTVPYI